ncbi:unnamed protein product [Cuscuta epithymum]|uniref:Uncharacterized protein n=1 Tax=Cuscuta epithymum TaxID=186058 RepID=A0AAV0GBJ6_9ASTE|nr:unnamed protein product [Cuscuta epithymum]
MCFTDKNKTLYKHGEYKSGYSSCHSNVIFTLSTPPFTTLPLFIFHLLPLNYHNSNSPIIPHQWPHLLSPSQQEDFQLPLPVQLLNRRQRRPRGENPPKPGGNRNSEEDSHFRRAEPTETDE